MKEFSYTVQDALGIHARPAGLLAKQAKKFASKITVTNGGKSADATRVMALMTLGVHQGQTVHLIIEGEDEEAALEAVQAFFQENL